MYNYLPQPQYMPGIKGHPVSSFDEVRTAVIDFDGSVFYFPDPQNKKIYTKQINMDGTMGITVYEPVREKPQPEFITREEFEAKLSELAQRKEYNNEYSANNTNDKSRKQSSSSNGATGPRANG